MVFHVHQALHLLGPQARLQALDQARQAFTFTARGGEEFAVGRGTPGDVAGVQLQVQCGCGQFHLRQPLAQQHQQVGGVARRLAQRDAQVRVCRRLCITAPARFMLHHQREAAHKSMLGAEPCHQALQQHAGAVEHLLGGVGAGKQLKPAFKCRRQGDGLARVGPGAQSAVQFMQQRFAEAARQPGARQAPQVTQRAQAHALQRLPMFAAGAEQPHRGGVQRSAKCGQVGAMPLPVHTRQQRGPLRRGGADGVNAVAQRRQRVVQALQQSLQAAKVAQAALHVEQHGMGRNGGVCGRLDGHAGRETQRHMGHGHQRLRITRRMGLAQNQVRRKRQRGGALEAGLDAQGLGRRVGADDAARVHQRQRQWRLDGGLNRCGVGFLGGYVGGVERGCAMQRGRKRFQRQQRQMQGNPEHGTDLG